MKAIGSPLDFVGLNIYVPLYAGADGSAQGYAVEPMPTSYPHMASPWLKLGPDLLELAKRRNFGYLMSFRKTALSRTETRSQLVQLARLDELGELVDPVIEDQNV